MNIDNQDEVEITYELYIDDNWQAGSTDLREAMYYAHQYIADGMVQIFKVETKRTLIMEIGGDL